MTSLFDTHASVQFVWALADPSLFAGKGDGSALHCACTWQRLGGVNPKAGETMGGAIVNACGWASTQAGRLEALDMVTCPTCLVLCDFALEVNRG